MIKTAIYNHRNQFISFDKERVNQVLTDLEKGLRTGLFEYKQTSMTKKQFEQMEREWPAECVEFFKKKAKELANGEKVNPQIAYQAAVATLLEFVLPNRVKNAAIRLSETTIKRTMLLDISISMMLDVAFDASYTPTKSRIISNKKIEPKYTLTANKFAIDCDDVDNADIFVYALYNEQLEKAVLIGWKTQNEIRACKRGNKKTDPDNCPWSKMSFYFTYPQLNPMSDLATQFGLKQLPENVLLEQVTQLYNLPIPDSSLTKSLTMGNTKAKDDFYKVLGLEDPQPLSEEKPPTPQNEDWGI